jgi:hypothetical protein
MARRPRSGRRLAIVREIDENDARPVGFIGMRHGIADPGWRIRFSDLEQGSKRPVCRAARSTVCSWPYRALSRRFG